MKNKVLGSGNMIILIILILVLILIPFLINKNSKNKDTLLDNVKLQEETIKRDSFAMMLEQSDGTYIEDTSSSSFPTNMKFNSELSGCVDADGNKIENALSYNDTNKLVTVQTNRTSYCYLYFDLNNELNSNIIDNGTTDVWQSTLEDDGYRFVGTNPNNYICFGTSDKSTCTGDTDKYMYRIIGVFEDENGVQHAKLIKKEALNTTYVWNSNYSTDVDWNNSDLYKGLNGSYFLTNTDYSYMQDSTWTDKIATWNYTMTNTKTWENYTNNSVYGPYYFYETGKTMYLHELNRSGKSSESCHWSSSTSADCNVGEWKPLSTKISLMYASDYALSLGNDALSYTSSLNYSTMKTGWMLLSNNDTNAPDSWEWTMSRGGKCDSNYYAWTVHSNGFVDRTIVHNAYAVRPVFYLASDVELLGGTGTISDPYIIS